MKRFRTTATAAAAAAVSHFHSFRVIILLYLLVCSTSYRYHRRRLWSIRSGVLYNNNTTFTSQTTGQIHATRVAITVILSWRVRLPPQSDYNNNTMYATSTEPHMPRRGWTRNINILCSVIYVLNNIIYVWNVCIDGIITTWTRPLIAVLCSHETTLSLPLPRPTRLQYTHDREFRLYFISIINNISSVRT